MVRSSKRKTPTLLSRPRAVWTMGAGAGKGCRASVSCKPIFSRSEAVMHLCGVGGSDLGCFVLEELSLPEGEVGQSGDEGSMGSEDRVRQWAGDRRSLARNQLQVLRSDLGAVIR